MKTRGREAYLNGEMYLKNQEKHLIYDIFADLATFHLDLARNASSFSPIMQL